MRKLRVILGPRAAACEALLGLGLITAGVSMTFSWGVALIVLGLVLGAAAIWPLWGHR